MLAMWYGHAWGAGPWFLVFPLLWIAFIATVLFFVVRRGRSWHARSGESALGELYARGEITEEEYRKRQRVLREHAR
jgi:putative membrane protein